MPLRHMLLGIFGAVIAFSALTITTAAPQGATLTVKHDHPFIFYHGRWDSTPGTWWPASGFKLNVINLKTLTLNLGPHTPSPFASLGVSIGGSDFFIVNASVGANTILLPTAHVAQGKLSSTAVRINAAGWQTYRFNLESITLNNDAILVPYTASKRVFQFIGDSFSSGYLLPMGADQAWNFLVGEKYRAETRITAQAGAALMDIPSYGNVHGMSYQYFMTEDTSFYYTTDHNFTTPWDFSRDQPPATHLVIHIGANDAAQGVTDDQFVQVYVDFLTRIRRLYPRQPIFALTPWGWPNADGNVYYYYDGQYQRVLDARKALGDNNMFLVNTTGWVTWEDVFPDSLHPTVAGQVKIANNFIDFLKTWGLSP